ARGDELPADLRGVAAAAFPAATHLVAVGVQAARPPGACAALGEAGAAPVTLDRHLEVVGRSLNAFVVRKYNFRKLHALPRGSTMTSFVHYHDIDALGYLPLPARPLLPVDAPDEHPPPERGDTVYLVSGIGSPKRHHLWEVYTVDRVL